MFKQNIKYRSGFVSNSSSSSFIICYAPINEGILDWKYTKENFPNDIYQDYDNLVGSVDLIPYTYEMYDMMRGEAANDPKHFPTFIRMRPECVFPTDIGLNRPEIARLARLLKTYPCLREVSLADDALFHYQDTESARFFRTWCERFEIV